jgi:dehydrogenase/reductase SDR family member 4
VKHPKIEQEGKLARDPFSLAGKVAIVTGSSRGIGRSVAEEMARAGAKVIISSRKIEACEAVCEELRVQGHDATAIACHIGRKEELQNLVERTIERHGRIDCVVANAAVNPVFGPLKELSDEAWDKVMATNLRSTFWLANLALPLMAERGGGSFIIMSSIAALLGTRSQGAYSVSKAAEAQLARNLAVEWGPRNIRVNAIAPGVIKTDFARALWENQALVDAIARQSPLGRIGEPRDIGPVAVFLACEASRYVTGQLIQVDGGLTVAEPWP